MNGLLALEMAEIAVRERMELAERDASNRLAASRYGTTDASRSVRTERSRDANQLMNPTWVRRVPATATARTWTVTRSHGGGRPR